MSLKVLIVPDKFKGTLTASQAADLIARGWRTARPDDALELVPMSDGGDGFGEVLGELSRSEARLVLTVDAAHQPVEAQWWFDPRSRTAIIESARVIGLAMLTPAQSHPFALDTFGLGRVLAAAHEAGAERCLVGIGGSATNDGGFGVARALGWKFLEADGAEIISWTRLAALARVARPAAEHWPRIAVAVDVQNPLLGPMGASRIYGPQKGLRPEDMPHAEAALQRLVEVVKRELEIDAAEEAGTGAAGGLGYGLRCFCGATLEPGFALFSHQSNLRERIRAADLVITAEGAIDASTLMGKGTGEVAALCKGAGVPCLGLAGTLLLDSAAEELARQKFTRFLGIVPQLTTAELAKRNPDEWLPRLAAVAAQEWAWG